MEKPYPEIVEQKIHDKPWIFHVSPEYRASVDLRKRVFKGPFWAKTDPYDTRRHELGHIKWSPEKESVIFDGPMEYVDTVEDARINSNLRNIGLPIRAKGIIDRIENKKQGVLTAVAVLGCDGIEAPYLESWQKEIVKEVKKILGKKKIISFEQTKKAAKYLRDIFETPEVEPIETIPINDKIRTLVEEGDYHAAGEMAIETPPLTQTVVGKQKRVHCATDEGSELVYAYRYSIDGKIFRRKRKKPSFKGTVLIDCSGSMNWYEEELMSLIKTSKGACLIALYAGQGSVGTLRIIAQDGKMAESEELSLPYHGNVVDLPALEWLEKQKAPRFWFSDGQITGKGDMGSRPLRIQCEEVRSRGNITRTTKIQDIEKAFA